MDRKDDDTITTGTAPKGSRQTDRAAKLRENLRRRKEQTRQRTGDESLTNAADSAPKTRSSRDDTADN